MEMEKIKEPGGHPLGNVSGKFDCHPCDYLECRKAGEREVLVGDYGIVVTHDGLIMGYLGALGGGCEA